MNSRRSSRLSDLPPPNYTAQMNNNEDDSLSSQEDEIRPTRRRRTDTRRVSESPVANEDNDDESVGQPAVLNVQPPHDDQPAFLNVQPPNDGDNVIVIDDDAIDVLPAAENNNIEGNVFVDNWVAILQPTTQANISNKISNVPVHTDEESGKEFIEIAGNRYFKTRPQNGHTTSAVFSHNLGTNYQCRCLVIRQEDTDQELSLSTGISTGDVFMFSDNDDSLHSPSCPYYTPDATPTLFQLPDHIVFPEKYDATGAANVSVDAIKVNPSLLSAVRMNVLSGRGTKAGNTNSRVFSEDVVRQAGNFIKCFEFGLLPGVAEGTKPSLEFFQKYLNLGDFNRNNFSQRVLAPHRNWDLSPFYKRVVNSVDEPDAYHDQIQRRVLVYLMIETERWLKKLHNIEVIGGYLRQDPDFPIDESNYEDAYYQEAEEVGQLLTTIDEISDDQVNANRGITLLDVATIGRNVPRSRMGYGCHASVEENDIIRAVFMLSYKFMLPPMPDDVEVDYDATYFGARISAPTGKKGCWFDALCLLQMLTGRMKDGSGWAGIRGMLERRGMSVRTKNIVQKDVSEDKSIRILIHLRSLAEQFLQRVLEENEAAAADNDDDEEEVNE